MMNRLLVLLLALFLSNSAYSVDWITHRGNSCGEPENTLRAVADSWRLGADAVEIDVRFSTDGVAYLFHDNRYRDKNLIELSYQQIKALIGETHVPRLSSVLMIGGSGYYILDLKQPKINNIPVLKEVLEESGLAREQVYIQSRDIHFLKAADEAIENASLAYLTSLRRSRLTQLAPSPESILAEVSHADIHALTIKGRSFLNTDYITTLRSTGLRVFVWTINKSERTTFYENAGVDGIITDAIATIAKLDDICELLSRKEIFDHF